MQRADLWQTGEGSRGRAERTPFGAAGPGSEKEGSDLGTTAICEDGEESASLNEERSHPLLSGPKILLRRRRRRNAAGRRRRGLRAWKETNNGAGSNPKMTQNYIRITMNI